MKSWTSLSRAARLAGLSAALDWPGREDISTLYELAAEASTDVVGGDLFEADPPGPEQVEEYWTTFEVGGSDGAPVSLREAEFWGGHPKTLEEILRYANFFGLQWLLKSPLRPDHLTAQLELAHHLALLADQAHFPKTHQDARSALDDLLRVHILPVTREARQRLAGRKGFYARLMRHVETLLEEEARFVTRRPWDSDDRTPNWQLRHFARSRLPVMSGYRRQQLMEAPMIWDKVVKSTHPTNCWYGIGCNMNLFVKDGWVIREEQAGNYPPRNSPQVPDFNPRGCQKGILYTRRLYDAGRVKFPMKRQGPRGSGQWQRTSWDQALEEIGGKLLDVIAEHGPKGVAQGAGTRVLDLEDLTATDFFGALGMPKAVAVSDIGDDHQGAAMTLGKEAFGDSADNVLDADVILMWGGNPAVTHIPNYHFFTEARYRGATVVVITPDFNPSAIHADWWIPIVPGTDQALALGLVRLFVDNGWMDQEFVKEQTDLPLLVRDDSRRFLTEADLKKGGSDETFYRWDSHSNGPVAVSRETLKIEDGVDPDLLFEGRVKGRAGSLAVRTVFSLLKEELSPWNVEHVQEVTGIAADTVTRLAERLYRQRRFITVSSFNWGKFYHGDLIERSLILLHAVAGSMGRPGAGYNAHPLLTLATAYGTSDFRSGTMVSRAEADPRVSEWRARKFTDEGILAEYDRDAVKTGAVLPSSLFYFVHAGIAELAARYHNWDPELPRPVEQYVREAIDHGWQNPGGTPKMLIQWGGNFVRRIKPTEALLNRLIPQLEMLVTCDWRMNSTALMSDYVLPVAAWYERDFVVMNWATNVPYCHIAEKGMEPQFEALSGRELWIRMARTVERLARERGWSAVRAADGAEFPLNELVDKVTAHEMYPEGRDADLVRDLVSRATNIKQENFDDLRSRGFAEVEAGRRDHSIFSMEVASDLKAGEAIIPLVYHVREKMPYATRTGHLQFYLDHPWFLELGQALPRWHPTPKSGGDYPLFLTGGHFRWSIHSDFIDDDLLLGLQRGEPLIYLSVADAQARGIGDGDRVEVFNDIGRFQCQVCVAPGVRPGQAIIYHGWENFQFSRHGHFKTVMASPINPVELAGGEGHLRARATVLVPGLNDRGTRVDVSLVKSSAAEK